MPSQTPWSCHSWSRRWQVERLPYFGGQSFQRAPECSTQRMPFKVRRSSARGLPLLLCCGSSGAISFHCSSPNSSSITPTPVLRVGAQFRLSSHFWDRFIGLGGLLKPFYSQSANSAETVFYISYLFYFLF